MAPTNDKIAQSVKFSNALKQIKIDVTALDRREACLKLGINRITLSNYLNGKVRDNDTAAALITFFRKRIEKRNLVLA